MSKAQKERARHCERLTEVFFRSLKSEHSLTSNIGWLTSTIGRSEHVQIMEFLS